MRQIIVLLVLLVVTTFGFILLLPSIPSGYLQLLFFGVYSIAILAIYLRLTKLVEQ